VGGESLSGALEAIKEMGLKGFYTFGLLLKLDSKVAKIIKG